VPVRSLVQAFLTVFPAELPDKTMFATIVLVTRHRRPLWVWVGAVAAFTVHVVVAVAAGRLLALLPPTPVQVVTAVLFAVGAVLLWRESRSDPEAELAEEEAEAAQRPGATPASSTVRAAVLGSFGLIVVAEWGDLTQLATASLAARSGAPVATGVGALLALASVAALAAAVGRQLVARVPLARISLVGAAVFASLAVWTVIDLAR
jgi:putative Ca2+/H+ antiporter (TMEM165/GDT1 family)